jgi:hypothetical protein
VTVSPPVSPSVVAAILMIQKTRVTSGILLSVSRCTVSFTVDAFRCSHDMDERWSA